MNRVGMWDAEQPSAIFSLGTPDDWRRHGISEPAIRALLCFTPKERGELCAFWYAGRFDSFGFISPDNTFCVPADVDKQRAIQVLNREYGEEIDRVYGTSVYTQEDTRI